MTSPGIGSRARPPAIEVPSAGDHAVTLQVGQQLLLTLAGGETAATKDPAVLMVGPAGTFTAVADGTTTVAVERRPSCSPGQLCSQLIQLVGTVTVTVSS